MASVNKSNSNHNDVIPEAIVAEMLLALPVLSIEPDRKALMRAELLGNVDAQVRASNADDAARKPIIVRADEGDRKSVV